MLLADEGAVEPEHAAAEPVILAVIVAGLRAFSSEAPAESDRKAAIHFLLLLVVLSAMCLIQVPLGSGTPR